MKKAFGLILIAFCFLSFQPTIADDYENSSAWKLLDETLLSGKALIRRLTVASKSSCGEVDPYYIGDACYYGVEGSSKIKGIFLFDYLDSELVVGQKIVVVAAALTSQNGDIQKPGDYAARIVAEGELPDDYALTRKQMERKLDRYLSYCDGSYRKYESKKFQMIRMTTPLTEEQLRERVKAEAQSLTHKEKKIHLYSFEAGNPNRSSGTRRDCARIERQLAKNNFSATAMTFSEPEVEVLGFTGVDSKGQGFLGLIKQYD